MYCPHCEHVPLTQLSSRRKMKIWAGWNMEEHRAGKSEYVHC